jgi:hypothetical protein
MVDVNRHSQGFIPAKKGDSRVGEPSGIGDRDPGADPEAKGGAVFRVSGFPEPPEQTFQNAVRDGQGISPGHEDFPDFGMGFQIGGYRIEFGAGYERPGRPHPHPAETVAAVPGTAAPGQEQGPVPVLVYEPWDRQVAAFPQGIFQGKRVRQFFPGVREELPAYRIRLVRPGQGRKVGSHREREAAPFLNRRDIGAFLRADCDAQMGWQGFQRGDKPVIRRPHIPL